MAEADKPVTEEPEVRQETVHEHPPELAENFEHTIKRLIARRDKARAEKMGLYKSA